MIHLTNITMRYPAVWKLADLLVRRKPTRADHVALKGINLSIRKGESVALLGPNGSGKTTLLKVMGGLIYPSEGTVTVGGFDATRNGSEVRRLVSFVLNEDRSFYWRLTGYQNLEFFAALDNIFGRQRRKKVLEMLEAVGIEKAMHVPVANYSTGMRQRLAIARALLCDPEVLLLDEPTRSLDPAGAEDLRNLIQRYLYANGQRTLVMATHILEEACSCCDTAHAVIHGEIVNSTPIVRKPKDHSAIDSFYLAATEKGNAQACYC